MTSTSHPHLSNLRTYLARVPSGPIKDSTQLAFLLASCWEELSVTRSGGMQPHKLPERMEDVTWDPPILTFQIERHGATVQGSVYAEVQIWNVDIQNGSAVVHENAGRRLVRPRSSPLDVEPIAREIAILVAGGKQDSRLKWTGADKVRVLTGKIIPAGGPKQTVTGRRRRFLKTLEKQLASHGWQRSSSQLLFVRNLSS